MEELKQFKNEFFSYLGKDFCKSLKSSEIFSKCIENYANKYSTETLFNKAVETYQKVQNNDVKDDEIIFHETKIACYLLATDKHLSSFQKVCLQDEKTV